MTEKIRAEQIQQGYEPCFGTDRVSEKSWRIANCTGGECCYYYMCRGIFHWSNNKLKNAVIETIESSDGLACAFACIAPNSEKEFPIGGTLKKIKAQGVAGAKAGKSLTITIESTEKVSEDKLKAVVDEARKISKRGKK